MPPNSTEYWFELSFPGLPGNNWENCISSFDSTYAWWEVSDLSYARSLLAQGTGDNPNCSGYNDRMSSLRIACDNGRSYGLFTVDRNANYSGNYVPFKIYRQPRTDYKAVFEIPLLDPYWNDRISSIETYSNGRERKLHTWHFYRNEGHADRCLTMGGAYQLKPNLRQDGCNDAISSIRFTIDQ